jgi:hypothetical protein
MVSSFIRVLLLLLTCSIILLLTYTEQLADANEYMGMQAWEMTELGYFLYLIGLPIIAYITTKFRGIPSDFFCLFYCTIAILSYLIFHTITGPLTANVIIFGWLILFAPLISIQVWRKLLPPIKFNGQLNSNLIELIVLTSTIFILFFSIIYSPASASFGLDDSYDRRIEGRDIYTAGSVLAYGMAMTMNGFIPYLAFRSGLSAKYRNFAFASIAAVAFYWLLGVKGPFLYLFAALALGVFVRNHRIFKVRSYFLIVIIFLGLLVGAEWLVFDKYSLLADYFFRRLFIVQAEVQAYYLQFLFSEKSIEWSWIFGSVIENFHPTYYIGEYYFNNFETNVNTNAFFDQLAAKGLVGYSLVLFIVPIILVIFDRLYQSSKNSTYIFLGFLYGLLVVEQAYSVAFVSSGVGVLFMLTLLEKNSGEALG